MNGTEWDEMLMRVTVGTAIFTAVLLVGAVILTGLLQLFP